jgi:hypothetical protein
MKSLAIILCASLPAAAVIIDRTAIVIDKQAILDSQIDRDIRLTAYLNKGRADFGAASRKKAASRLIDQELIRQQIRSGTYPVAPETETNQLLDQIKHADSATDAVYRSTLLRYGIDEAELRTRLSWQLTVLRFIDARFRAQVVVSDAEIQDYYAAHRTEEGTKSLDDERSKMVETITAERVNKLFDDWLDESRKSARIDYLEKSLQ